MSHALWSRHPGLVWSNTNASDSVRIRAALLRPSFALILDVGRELGLLRVEAEWRKLAEEDGPEARRAAPVVERILANVRRGAALAADRH